MYKFRYSTFNSTILLLLCMVCAGFLIFGFIYSSSGGYSNIEIIALSLMTLIFGGGVISTFYMLNKYTAVTITISNEGIEKKTLSGKKLFINREKIVDIREEDIPDYISGKIGGYKFIFINNNIEDKIEIGKSKKVTEALKKLEYI